MKSRVVVKGIINYIFAMIFAVIFALFLDANVGWFMLIALIMAPLLSVFFAWLSAGCVAVSCEMDEALLSKGDSYHMNVCVQNRSIFPTPPLTIALTNEAGVRSENPKMLVSVLSGASQNFEIVFKAKICGKSGVGIEEIRATDYFGLFSFPLKKVDCDSLKKNVAVIPDIAEISARDDKLVKAIQTSRHADDSDDTVESAAFAFGGFPGYESRDYVPGDPLKRINWKQSAKRNRLLVRLDDEIASQSINVVLDSVFERKQAELSDLPYLQQYSEYEADEILPKIAEDAVENALGIIEVLLRHNYTINFYALMGEGFSKYEITDEGELESVRLELANYRFSEGNYVPRIPRELSGSEKVSIFSTPNSYAEAHAILQSEGNTAYTTIYSVMEEAGKQEGDIRLISLRDYEEKQPKKQGLKEKLKGMVGGLLIPCLLALLLSISVFSIFEIPVNSYWTLAEILVCVGSFALCTYVNKHRVIGSMLITVLAMGIFAASVKIVFGQGYGLSYMYWFLSGGESVESTFPYLLTLLMVFTVFFSMVVFYFSTVLYRTSFLMLVSLLPFVIHVKVMHEINMVQVVFITVLNIAVFLINTRTAKDKGKKIVGYADGLVSLGLYAVIFVMIGLAVPKEETRYYYLFENAFLGGNVNMQLPEQYSTMSEYSGNADGFNELNNRKLYVISSVEPGTTLYLKRQTFDCYDFEHDRWYSLDYCSDAVYTQNEWIALQDYKNISLLAEALFCAEEYEPGFLEIYGMQNIAGDYEDSREIIYVETTNFPSAAYVTPANTIKVRIQENMDDFQEYPYVSRGGVFQRAEGLLYSNLEYTVEYFDDNVIRNTWIATGGANLDSDTSLEMLENLKRILEKNGESEYVKVADAFLTEAREAQLYLEMCEENTEEIPESVKNLALEITEGCVYDWEKAAALQNYFSQNDFVYDLSYKAPDDSVEYFLFEGKTGTCSDYASAFVLMARAAGLTVRYVEGFVPEEEYNGEYVARTQNGHAYPEVYLPNTGYVVYEATRPARYVDDSGNTGGITAFIMTIGIRIVAIFALVSGVILILLFLRFIAAPHVKEAFFLAKVRKADANRAIVLIYRRIMEKLSGKTIKAASTYTPYEYAEQFETCTGYDMSELALMVEKATYAKMSFQGKDKAKALEIYKGAKRAVKEKKKV